MGYDPANTLILETAICTKRPIIENINPRAGSFPSRSLRKPTNPTERALTNQ